MQGEYIAWKSIDIRPDVAERKLRKEIAALWLWKHVNIVELLASFTYEREFSSADIQSVNLFFPFEEFTLETWINLSQAPPEFGEQRPETQRRFLFESVYGLFPALWCLHRELDDGLIAIHYDIKPDKILVFGNEFMLTESGHTELMALGVSDGQEIRHYGTYDYQPPGYFHENGDRADRSHKEPSMFGQWAALCFRLLC